jgi:hypothetical protein
MTQRRRSSSKSFCKAADKQPNAAAFYCDCQFTGGRDDIEIAPSIEGESLGRVIQYVDNLSAAPVRGLIRKAAIRQAGLVRSDAPSAAGGNCLVS